MKVRSPKAEGRRKAEDRTPKVGAPAYCRVTHFDWSKPAICGRSGLAGLACGLRPLRLGLWLLAAQPIFGAATNVPADDEIPPLRPPHAEIPTTFWDQYSVWVIIAGVFLVVLVGAAIWFFTRPKPPVVVPPEVVARAALEPLRQQAEDGLLLSRVSQIVRHYVAAVFGLPSEEYTTAEFCRALAAHEQIGTDLVAALSEFLRQCDQRKFSPPSPAPPLSAVAQALRLVEQTQARSSALAQAAAQPPPKIPSPPVGARA